MTWTAREGQEGCEIIDEDDDILVCLVPQMRPRYHVPGRSKRIRKIASLPDLIELAEAVRSSTQAPELAGWADAILQQIACGGPPSLSVIVGNIGTVYDGDILVEAEQAFRTYVKKSKSGKGRAGGESVVMMRGEEILQEYKGTRSDE